MATPLAGINSNRKPAPANIDTPELESNMPQAGGEKGKIMIEMNSFGIVHIGNQLDRMAEQLALDL